MKLRNNRHCSVDVKADFLSFLSGTNFQVFWRFDCQHCSQQKPIPLKFSATLSTITAVRLRNFVRIGGGLPELFPMAKCTALDLLLQHEMTDDVTSGVARNFICGVYVLTRHCNFKTRVNVPHVNKMVTDLGGGYIYRYTPRRYAPGCHRTTTTTTTTATTGSTTITTTTTIHRVIKAQPTKVHSND